MNKLAENLRASMEWRGMSQEALAERVGCSQTTISKILRGMSERTKFLGKIAEALGVDAIVLESGNASEWLRSRSPVGEPSARYDVNVAPVSKPIRLVPLISSVMAGKMTSVVDPYSLGACSREIAVSEVVSDSAFALEIKGDSMLPEYHEGDIVIIDPAVTPQPGDYVVVKNQEEEATFKKYRPRGRNDRGEEYFEVVPLNPDYPTLRSDVDSLYIVGTEVEHHKLRSRRRSHSRC